MYPILEVESKVMGGGGSNPIFPHGEKWEKSYGKRGKSIHFPLFPYTFSPFFLWEKWGWTPQVIRHYNKNSATTQLLLKNHYRISRI